MEAVVISAPGASSPRHWLRFVTQSNPRGAEMSKQAGSVLLWSWYVPTAGLWPKLASYAAPTASTPGEHAGAAIWSVLPLLPLEETIATPAVFAAIVAAASASK